MPPCSVGFKPDATGYDDQGFRVRRVARQEIDGREREVELLYPSMYFALESQRDARGRLIPDTACAVNNIFLNGVRVAAALPDGQARYYLTDQVDSVKVVTNDAGMVLTSHEYLPFGESWIVEGDEKNAPKYNSQELDKESGYYFYNARHYDPEIGRFVTADAVVDGENSTQGWNRFAYCHNNPIIYKDPTGHMKVYPKGLEPNPKPDPISQLFKDAADYATEKMINAKQRFKEHFRRGDYDKALVAGGKAIYYALPSFLNEKVSDVLSGKASSLELISGRTGGATDAKAVSKELSKTINEKTTKLITKIPHHDKLIEYGSAFRETFAPTWPDMKQLVSNEKTKLKFSVDQLIKAASAKLGHEAGKKLAE